VVRHADGVFDELLELHVGRDVGTRRGFGTREEWSQRGLGGKPARPLGSLGEYVEIERRLETSARGLLSLLWTSWRIKGK
jgi:hypothetical protein